MYVVVELVFFNVQVITSVVMEGVPLCFYAFTLGTNHIFPLKSYLFYALDSHQALCVY